MYRIYINQTALIITETAPFSDENYQQIEPEGFVFTQFYQRFKQENSGGIFVLLTSNARRLFKQIKQSLKIIKAAGGVVRSDENKFLFIYRKGVWDLPKGKIEKGEKTKIAAIREVEEECGIIISSAGDKICKTYHVYEMSGQIVFKKTSWYWMKADNLQPLIPQLEEDITDVQWMAPGDFSLVKQNTYPLIRDVMSLIEG
ncbi:NUDIX hydrolase [Daejeonella oryzae]|uniref:NUDIX hydrolase n=1 Tax=Daejeonella oryzae TaxID=1122943 RepID=UPI0003F8D308|nr:NUDIX domain-containing protein [Daejeonella oryzae]